MTAGCSTWVRFFLVLVLAGSITGFKIFGKHMENFFPLDEGRSWIYDFTRTKGSQTVEKGKVTITNLAAKVIEGKNAVPRKYEYSNKRVFQVFFQNDTQGILFIATKGEKDSEPKPFAAPFYYIKNPLETGASWGGGQVPQGTVQSTTERVTVPAGEFKNCVQVKLTYPPNMAMAEATIWFAEKVGIVKSSYRHRDGLEEQFQLTSMQ